VSWSDPLVTLSVPQQFSAYPSSHSNRNTHYVVKVLDIKKNEEAIVVKVLDIKKNEEREKTKGRAI
jgi:hypothetical protein